MSGNNIINEQNISQDASSSSSSEIITTKEKPNNLRVFTTCTAIAIGGIIFGYDTGAISGMVNMPNYIQSVGEKNPITDTFFIPSWRSGLIVGAVSIGGLIGSLVFGKIAERYGRRRAVVISSGLVNAAVGVQICGHKFWPVVFLGRIITGFCIGGISAVCPMYLSETAPTHQRAFLVSIFQVLVTVGILIGQLLAFGCSFWENSDGQFILPLTFISVFAILLCLAGIFYIPESARYLVSKNKLEQGAKSLGRTMKIPYTHGYVQQEIMDIQAAVEASRTSGNASWKELVTGKPKIFYRVVLGISIMMLQQLTGINYFFYYGTSLFKEISDINPFATALILGTVNVIGTIALLPVVSKYPRRIVLMAGSLVMFFSFILFASLGSFTLYDLETGLVNTNVGTGMIILACLFIIGFAGTWAPVSYLVISEMFPQRIRSKAISLAVASNWLINACITFLTPIATSSIGYKFGFVFSFFTLISFIVVYFFVYETRGHTLEAIEEMFASGISARQSPGWTSNNEKEDEV